MRGAGLAGFENLGLKHVGDGQANADTARRSFDKYRFISTLANVNAQRQICGSAGEGCVFRHVGDEADSAKAHVDLEKKRRKGGASE